MSQSKNENYDDGKLAYNFKSMIIMIIAISWLFLDCE